MEINLRCNGLDNWLRKIGALQGLERNPEVDKALGRGAARMQAQVKLLTPKDTGNLQNKIVLDHVQMMAWAIDTNVEYAVFVEFGTGKLGDPAVPHTSKDSWTYYSDELKRFITTHGQEPAHMFTEGFALTYKKAINIVEVEIRRLIRNA